MTYKEIKNEMIKAINDSLESYIEDLNVEDLVDLETIHEFLWEKDFGRELAEAYVDEHQEELVQDLLEQIYNEIDTDDLTSPF